jgi:hypothetical protein
MLLRAVFTEVFHVQRNGHWKMNSGEYQNYKSYPHHRFVQPFNFSACRVRQQLQLRPTYFCPTSASIIEVEPWLSLPLLSVWHWAHSYECCNFIQRYANILGVIAPMLLQAVLNIYLTTSIEDVFRIVSQTEWLPFPVHLG